MSQDIELSKFGEYLATQLGIDTFSGGILASLIFSMLVLIPILFLTKGKNSVLLIIIGISCMSFCVALAWLPVWVMAVIALFVAFSVSSKVKSWI